MLDAPVDAYGELHTLTRELYELLFDITNTDPDLQSAQRNGSFLSTGHAIGLTWAAMCIHDIMRTKKFMDGLYQAVVDCHRAKPGTPVHILYAGTGPFATLVLPLMAHFTSQQVQFTFLEVNSDSFACLATLLTALDLHSYVRGLHLADATSWQSSDHEPVTILLTETMQRTLKCEPQVAICLNLLPQLAADTLIIPEEVTVKLSFLRHCPTGADNVYHPPFITALAPVFSLNRVTIMENAGAYQQTPWAYNFSPVEVSIPPQPGQASSVLALLTDIVVYKRIVITYNESGLTMPHLLSQYSTGVVDRLRFHYRVSNNPGLIVAAIEA
ncbi:hypothetical protein GCM10028807_51910 [Spirosoma daeguense]